MLMQKRKKVRDEMEAYDGSGDIKGDNSASGNEDGSSGSDSDGREQRKVRDVEVQPGETSNSTV